MGPAVRPAANTSAALIGTMNFDIPPPSAISQVREAICPLTLRLFLSGRGNKSVGGGYDADRPSYADMQNDSDAHQAVWSGFEAEALPHVESLFRIAMWFERD